MNIALQVHANLDAVSESFQGILLDAYGVFWGGNEKGLLPGSKEAMEKLVSRKKIVGILTNTTQLASAEIKKLEAHGILKGKHFHFLVSGGEIAKSLFMRDQLPFPTPNKKYWVLGGDHPRASPHRSIFQESSYQETTKLNEADFIYVGIPHIKGEDQTDPVFFHEEIASLQNSGLPMVCANPDRFAHEGSPPRAVVRQGSLAAMYEALGGTVFYIGKPHPLAFSCAMDEFTKHHVTQSNLVVMVGDTPETDIRGALKSGMSAALVTETGLMGDRILSKGLEKSFNELAVCDKPTFFIKRFSIDAF